MDAYRKPAERVVEPVTRGPFFVWRDMTVGSQFLGIGLSQFLLLVIDENPARAKARVLMGSVLLAVSLAATFFGRWLRLRNGR